MRNDTPHSLTQRAQMARDRITSPPPPKKKAVPMSAKIDNLLAELRREGATLLRTGKKHSVSTTGRPISSAVAKVAVKDERFVVVTPPLIGDGIAQPQEWGPRDAR